MIRIISNNKHEHEQLIEKHKSNNRKNRYLCAKIVKAVSMMWQISSLAMPLCSWVRGQAIQYVILKFLKIWTKIFKLATEIRLKLFDAEMKQVFNWSFKLKNDGENITFIFLRNTPKWNEC